MHYSILARFREGSTWVSLGTLLMALGIGTGIDESTWAQIGSGVGAICTVVGGVIREPGSTK